MNKRANLQQSIAILESASQYSEDAKQLLIDYYDYKQQGQDFLAAKMVVDVVELFEKDILIKSEAKNG
jgi:hypothetical protein